MGRLVSGHFFEVLGIYPLLGRAVGPDDDRAGAPHVVVRGHSHWCDRFGADPT